MSWLDDAYQEAQDARNALIARTQEALGDAREVVYERPYNFGAELGQNLAQRVEVVENTYNEANANLRDTVASLRNSVTRGAEAGASAIRWTAIFIGAITLLAIAMVVALLIYAIRVMGPSLGAGLGKALAV